MLCKRDFIGSLRVPRLPLSPRTNGPELYINHHMGQDRLDMIDAMLAIALCVVSGPWHTT